MKKESLVLTLLGDDRPGLVEQLAATVAEHGGNWLESRMARLGGKFAGILRLECAPENARTLADALCALSGQGLSIELAEPEPAGKTEAAPRPSFTIDVMGNDRPGIVRQIAAKLAEAPANIEELESRLESAPMAGHPIFHMLATISLDPGTDAGTLVRQIETLGDDLSVSVSD